MSDRPAGRPAGRGHAFERLISLEPKARLTSGLLWWVPPSLLPCMEPMPNHASTQCGTWRVLPGGMSQMFRLLFLGNGWADCVEIWHALGDPLVTAYAVVTGRCMTARDRLRAWDVKFLESSNLTHKSCGIFVASWGFAHCIGTRLVFHNFFIST